MRIDLRYFIVLGALFAPASLIRLFFWMWDAPISHPTFAASISLLFGSAAALAVIVFLSDGRNAKPIWFPKESE